MGQGGPLVTDFRLHFLPASLGLAPLDVRGRAGPGDPALIDAAAAHAGARWPGAQLEVTVNGDQRRGHIRAGTARRRVASFVITDPDAPAPPRPQEPARAR